MNSIYDNDGRWKLLIRSLVPNDATYSQDTWSALPQITAHYLALRKSNRFTIENVCKGLDETWEYVA